MNPYVVAYVVGAIVTLLVSSVLLARERYTGDLTVHNGFLATMLGLFWPGVIAVLIVGYLVGNLGRWLSDRLEYNPPWRR